MKTSIKFSSIILIGISTLLLNSCKKGDPGEPGKDGSANVTALTFSNSGWTAGSSFWYKQLSCPELTSDNINSASVAVFWGTAANNWIALPYTYVATTNYFMNYLTTVGLVEVRWQYNGVGIGDNPDDKFGKTVQFKIVIIPPAARNANPNVNMNNYQEVKSAYQLTD